MIDTKCSCLDLSELVPVAQSAFEQGFYFRYQWPHLQKDSIKALDDRSQCWSTENIIGLGLLWLDLAILCMGITPESYL